MGERAASPDRRGSSPSGKSPGGVWRPSLRGHHRASGRAEPERLHTPRLISGDTAEARGDQQVAKLAVSVEADRKCPAQRTIRSDERPRALDPTTFQVDGALLEQAQWRVLPDPRPVARPELRVERFRHVEIDQKAAVRLQRTSNSPREIEILQIG